MNILIYKEGAAFSEINGRKLKSKTKPFLSFEYDELYYTSIKQTYTYAYEEKPLTQDQIQEIESFISNIEENRDIPIIQSLHKFLQETDWMVIREMETGKKMPTHIKEERVRAREKLHNFKG